MLDLDCCPSMPDAVKQWGPVVEDVIADHVMTGAVDAHNGDWWALLLLAICKRESGGGVFLHPRGPRGTGDNGHGLGLWQIDGRYHATWAAQVDESGEPLWWDPYQNCAMALRQMLTNYKAFPGADEAAVAAYNASVNSVNHAIATGQSIDSVTTGGNYVSAVLGDVMTWSTELTDA